MSLIINIPLFFCERERGSGGGGEVSLFTCSECKRHRNEDPHYYKRNIYHKTRKEHSQIEANFYIYANYGEKPVRYMPGMYLACVDIYNLIIALYKCQNFMLRLSIHTLDLITYYRQGKNKINISHSFFTLSVLITVFCIMISYLFYYRIMTDKEKTYISAGPYRRAVQH